MKLRFTIRDLLWLAVVVALAVGWWLNSRPQSPRRYDAYISGDKLILEDKKTGVQMQMPSDSLDPKAILRDMAPK
jgi:hypothetical protein